VNRVEKLEEVLDDIDEELSQYSSNDFKERLVWYTAGLNSARDKIRFAINELIGADL